MKLTLILRNEVVYLYNVYDIATSFGRIYFHWQEPTREGGLDKWIKTVNYSLSEVVDVQVELER